MSSEMGSLIERHGGVPYSAPAMQELYLKDSPDVQELVVDICRGRLDVMVLLTGVGTRAMLEVADEMGFKDELIGSFEEMTVIARSPKPARVLRQNKIRIDIMPLEPYTSEDLLASIKDLGFFTFVNTILGPQKTSSSIVTPSYTETLFCILTLFPIITLSAIKTF